MKPLPNLQHCRAWGAGKLRGKRILRGTLGERGGAPFEAMSELGSDHGVKIAYGVSKEFPGRGRKKGGSKEEGRTGQDCITKKEPPSRGVLRYLRARFLRASSSILTYVGLNTPVKHFH